MLKTDFQLAQDKVATMESQQLLKILQSNDTSLEIEWEIMEPMGIGSITTNAGLILADRIEQHILRELQRRADIIRKRKAQLTRF